MLVDNPILNSPFEEPARHWAYEEGQPVLKEGRRPAGYYLKPRTRGPQMSLFEEVFVPLEQVNTIRERVKAWRERGYPGVTPITRQLLYHWNHPERERKLLFCQREAVDTLTWLVEASPAEKQGIAIPRSGNGVGGNLTRYACKMETGSGKTVFMGMVIAWQVLNKLANPQDRRFSDAVLLVCPNLTIRERPQVLLPWKPGNYHEKFDLLPGGMMEQLQQGRCQITNWYLIQPRDDRRSKSVVLRGVESDTAFFGGCSKSWATSKTSWSSPTRRTRANTTSLTASRATSATPCRTHDQMVQAARSGVQTIAEGSVVSGTSKNMEMKLTNVARTSLEELRRDYDDFLRQRVLPLWLRDDPRRQSKELGDGG